MKGQREVTTEHHRNGRLQAQEANRVVNAGCSVISMSRARSREINPILANFSSSPPFRRSPASHLLSSPSAKCVRQIGALAGFPPLFVKSHQAHRDASLISFLSWTFPFTHFYRHLTGSCSVYHSEIKKVSPNCDFMLLNRVSSVEMRAQVWTCILQMCLMTQMNPMQFI